MNEKPILFKGDMVNSILAGRKTQTRRIVNLSRVRGFDSHDDWKSVGEARDGSWIFWSTHQPPEDTKKYYDSGGFTCHYGKVGDRLWVRETWKCEELESGLDGVRFRADDTFRAIENTMDAAHAWGEANRPGGKWRPAIFMSRWASRITLEIVNVRVERVQDITRDDAKAEGITLQFPNRGEQTWTYQSAYARLWDDVNAKRSFGWDVNPWVWVIEFKQVEI